MAGRSQLKVKLKLKLVLAPQMGQGIIPNTADESQGISFFEMEWELC